MFTYVYDLGIEFDALLGIDFHQQYDLIVDVKKAKINSQASNSTIL